ncbi:MAG TPA: hypothetical protein DCR46_08470 [Cytophagales bacterium]|nr:hypothetical protein [Cytophagales bacterium]
MPKILLYFSALMSLLYLYFGVYITLSSEVQKVIHFPYNIFVGLLLVGYGGFRVYRFYQLLVKNKND